MPRVKVEWRSASKECYRVFCETHPEIKISYRSWADIIYAFNYAFRDYILETGDRLKMPWGMGEFSILKKKKPARKTLEDGREVIKLPVDWAKTKLKGKRVFHFNLHTDGLSFKWKWFVKTARFKHSDVWFFIPSRISSRLIKHYLTIEDQQYKYQEWDIIS